MAYFKTNTGRYDFEGDEVKPSLAIEMEGEVDGPKQFHDLDIRIKVIEFLMESIDVKHMCNEDYEVFEKSMIRILKSVGSALQCENYFEREDDELKTVLSFLQYR